MKHVWKLNWKKETPFDDVEEIEVAEGALFTLEVQLHRNDEVIGSMEKIEAHQKAILHRAFSIFIFNDKY